MKKTSATKDWNILESNPSGPAELLGEMDEINVDKNIPYKPYPAYGREVAYNRRDILNNRENDGDAVAVKDLWTKKMGLEDAINKKITKFNLVGEKFKELVKKIETNAPLGNRDQKAKERYDQKVLQHNLSLNEDKQDLSETTKKLYTLLDSNDLADIYKKISQERIYLENQIKSYNKRLQDSISNNKNSLQARSLQNVITKLKEEMFNLKLNRMEGKRKGDIDAEKAYNDQRLSIYKKIQSREVFYDKLMNGPDPNLIIKGYVAKRENRIREIDIDIAIIDDILQQREVEDNYVDEKAFAYAFNLNKIKLAKAI